jgi:hypothetical protein
MSIIHPGAAAGSEFLSLVENLAEKGIVWLLL